MCILTDLTGFLLSSALLFVFLFTTTLFSLFSTNVSFPKLLLQSFVVQFISQVCSIPVCILIPSSLCCNSYVAFRDPLCTHPLIKVWFLLQHIISPHIRFLNKYIYTFCHQQAWEESLISFCWFTSLFAFRCFFQASDSLCVGNGKIHFHLGASYTFTSGGGMSTGSSHGSANALEISPPAFLTVTCS